MPLPCPGLGTCACRPLIVTLLNQRSSMWAMSGRRSFADPSPYIRRVVAEVLANPSGGWAASTHAPGVESLDRHAEVRGDFGYRPKMCCLVHHGLLPRVMVVTHSAKVHCGIFKQRVHASLA